jgi:tricorn protease-like protein
VWAQLEAQDKKANEEEKEATVEAQEEKSKVAQPEVEHKAVENYTEDAADVELMMDGASIILF